MAFWHFFLTLSRGSWREIHKCNTGWLLWIAMVRVSYLYENSTQYLTMQKSFLKFIKISADSPFLFGTVHSSFIGEIVLCWQMCFFLNYVLTMNTFLGEDKNQELSCNSNIHFIHKVCLNVCVHVCVYGYSFLLIKISICMCDFICVFYILLFYPAVHFKYMELMVLTIFSGTSLKCTGVLIFVSRHCWLTFYTFRIFCTEKIFLREIWIFFTNNIPCC